MKPGEKTICPVCGQEIFVQEKNLMDDWKVVGKVLVCPLCEAHLSRQSETSLDQDPEESSNISALTDLLGEDDTPEPEIDFGEESGHFCRDCTYFIKHPFMNRCTLHECEVSPMSDCDDFIRRDEGDEEE